MYSKTIMYRGEDEAVNAKEQILQQYYAKIFCYCYGILRNKQDAEDATQEKLMFVHNNMFITISQVKVTEDKIALEKLLAIANELVAE
ncbi:hypothetical protein MHH70_01325 [Metasolibacillus sp. FSL H7-0170]|uniref:hypothetical protein n=1 Tax=Metasolibacillus sp. FSL H7-0170 TaxID=2921431 RepID=UPI0031597A0F